MSKAHYHEMKKEGLAIPPDTFPPLIDNPLKHIYIKQPNTFFFVSHYSSLL